MQSKANTEALIIGAVVIGAIYYLTKGAAAVGAAASQAYTGAVNTTSDVLTNLFGPSTANATAVYYTVVFPDGTSHAVPSSTVDSNGNFVWTGYPTGSESATSYQLTTINGTRYALEN